MFLQNNVTGRQVRHDLDPGRPLPDQKRQSRDLQPSDIGDVVAGGYQGSAGPYAIKDGKIMTTVGNAPFEIDRLQARRKVFAARSNEFGYANYEIIPTPRRTWYRGRLPAAVGQASDHDDKPHPDILFGAACGRARPDGSHGLPDLPIGQGRGAGQRIEAADQVVLAHPDVAPGAYRVAYSIKGDIPVGQVISEVRTVPVAPAASGDLELLVRNKVSEHWTALGRTRLEVASWLRQLIQAAPVGGAPGWAWPGAPLPPSEADDQAWAARLALVAPRLESSDQLAAAIAFGELARAPYAAMRSLKGAVEPRKAAAWVDDPALADRRSA